MDKINVNPIPYLTWNWLKINNDCVSYDFSFSEENGTEIQIPDGVKVKTGKKIETLLPEPESAVGTAAADLISFGAKDGKIYEIGTSSNEKPLIIKVSGKEKNYATFQIFHAQKDSVSTVIIICDSKKDDDALSGTVSKIYAEENSKLHFIKVNLSSENTDMIDDTQVICGDNASVEFTNIQLGGNHVDAGFHATLYGYKSSFESAVAYLTHKSQTLDMNQVVVHKGKKTVCNMNTDGTLKDKGVKTYRGTIDLRTGCNGSDGNEMETTLLLSPDAVEKSAPIILCGEDDIKAEHGSTVGKLSKDMLFYMQSRGIKKEEAEELLSRAKITSVASKIPDESVQQEIAAYVDSLFSK